MTAFSDKSLIIARINSKVVLKPCRMYKLNPSIIRLHSLNVPNAVSNAFHVCINYKYKTFNCIKQIHSYHTLLSIKKEIIDWYSMFSDRGAHLASKRIILITCASPSTNKISLGFFNGAVSSSLLMSADIFPLVNHELF